MFLLAATHSSTQAQSACDDIARDVATAVEKEPGKVLMIVEDALVINESCACEIIRAAIIASKADAATVNQIVQTGITVAPKMAGVITDCASAASPGTTITSSQQMTAIVDEKNPGKNPIVAAPVPPASDDFYAMPGSIRGVYLIQPPAGGPIPCDPNKRKDCVICTSPYVAMTP